ncbi:MAG: J domain-containing protein [Microcoleaceae cyanobacterium]
MVSNYYETLEVKQTATQAEIKRAYRRLARQFHPDSQSATADHEQIVRINAAYEVLGDPLRRNSYDSQISPPVYATTRTVQSPSRFTRKTGQETDIELTQWVRQVYQPINRSLNRILKPLKQEIDKLSADPFDDELMEEFQSYVGLCRTCFEQAQHMFRSVPNPSNAAGVAAQLYYILNHVGDGIEELETFSLNYDDSSLHTGQELFRMAVSLRRVAQEELKNIA